MNRWVRCIFYDEILFSCIRGESPIPAARRMNHKNVLFSGIDQKGRFHACEIPRTGDSINSRAEERRDWTVSGLKTYLKLNRRVWMASWMYLHSTKILNTIKAHFTLHECCCNQKGKIPCHFFFFLKQNQWGWRWDVAHWVRAPTAHPEDLCSISSVHMQFTTAYNSQF